MREIDGTSSTREASGRGRTTQVRSVAKAAQVMLFLADQTDGSTATEVAQHFGLPTPTTYHLLNTLVGEGLLAKDALRRYALGPAVGVLADGFLRRMAPPAYLVPALHALADRTGETCYMSAWRSGDIAVLFAVEGSHSVHATGIHPGFAGNAHARASGKLLLALAAPEVVDRYLDRHPLHPVTAHTITDRAKLDAELAEIRDQGYAHDLEEFRAGVACLSAPAVIGSAVSVAFTVAAPVERFQRTRRDLLQALLDVCAEARAVAKPARQA